MSFRASFYLLEKTCPGGKHLEIESQECIPCLPGTFSSGDTVEYSKWKEIPKEFVADKSYGVDNINNCSTYVKTLNYCFPFIDKIYNCQ